METKTNTFAADEVKRLELRVAAADVEIKEAASRDRRSYGHGYYRYYDSGVLSCP